MDACICIWLHVPLLPIVQLFVLLFSVSKNHCSIEHSQTYVVGTTALDLWLEWYMENADIRYGLLLKEDASWLSKEEEEKNLIQSANKNWASGLTV